MLHHVHGISCGWKTTATKIDQKCLLTTQYVLGVILVVRSLLLRWWHITKFHVLCPVIFFVQFFLLNIRVGLTGCNASDFFFGLTWMDIYCLFMFIVCMNVTKQTLSNYIHVRAATSRITITTLSLGDLWWAALVV